jgi:diguanylate cyclase (GGDEF)-like protein
MRSVFKIALQRQTAILIVALGAMVVGTFGAVKITTDHLLNWNATSAARNWARLLADSVSDLPQIAAGEKPSAASMTFFEWARKAGQVFRYEIYNPEGYSQLVSENGGVLVDLSEFSADAVRSREGNAPVVDVREGDAAGRPSFYARAYVPVTVDGHAVAIVAAYVDQTEQRGQFHDTFLTAAAALCAMTGLAFGIPAVAWYRRTREKQITDRRMLESVHRGDLLADEARAQHLRLNAALTNMPHGLCMFDGDKRLIISNAHYGEMYRLPADLTAAGTRLESIVDYRRKIGNAPVNVPNYINHHDIEPIPGDTLVFEFELEDGRTIRISHLFLSDGGYVATHEDVTEAVRAAKRIGHMASHDALTNLPNRVLFREKLEEVLKTASPVDRAAVLCLDLDHFKRVNDTLGHAIGDSLLAEVARRLGACIRHTDTIARLGGDEFAVVQAGAAQPGSATDLAGRIIAEIGRPYDLNGHQVVIGTSIGIALGPTDGNDPELLLRNADMALYRAKSEGRGTHSFFEPSMDEKMQARRQLEVGLRRALVNEELELHYQPLVNLRDNSLSGFEALLRWRHPALGIISPLEFISLAEETGLIVAIGDWVIRRACADAAKWPGDLHVAVNLSAVQFRDRHLITTVFGALAASQLLPSRLELEITESTLLNKNEGTLATLHQLRDFGIRISMDDFGTGYSSLSYLRSFPFDKIKIDQSFVRDLGRNGDSRAIVRAVAGLGAALGMATTAEGVETREQLDFVRDEGCTEVQGFLFSRPLPVAELEKFFNDPKWSAATAA